jgi:hypothetical protein
MKQPTTIEREKLGADSVRRLISRICGFNHKSYEAWCPEHGRGLCVYEWSGQKYLEAVQCQTCKCGRKMNVVERAVNRDGWSRSIVWRVALDNFISHPITLLIVAAIIAAIVRTLLFG